MADAQRMTKRNFDAPDETRPAGSGKADVVGMGALTMMRVTLPPGWRWSQDVQPVAKTASCQAPHMLYILSGRLRTVMDDGSAQEFGPGDLGAIPPGHDAWVVGNAPAVLLDITGAGV